ncbi:MAG: RagB/SusD family nutrient uptake outer membrane protein [Bacteroidetes bacterium]|nr:RagB/SusD family nutrient uptake outer membrane protein [Bacteroidota bacterium]
MNIKIPHISHSLAFLLVAVFILSVSCEKFFDPEQALIVDENSYFQDWNEYRAAELGLYALQQELVTQLVVLGELRGDLLTVTENADRDLIEINLHQVSQGNKYASPLNFYRLIGACNRLSTRLEQEHPEVLKDTTANIYDRLYGEVLCMRAWAYFNAVKIFKEVPYVWPSLTTAEEISEYVSQSKTVINPVTIIYGQDGYVNDTIYGDTVVLERMYLDLPAIVDTFSNQLKEKIKLVGVIHNLVNEDASWDVTIWNRFAMHSLLGQMYMGIGNYGMAVQHFDQIMRFQRYNVLDGPYIRYGLDALFSRSNWKYIFTGIYTEEHIMTLWFNKSFQQQNLLQYLFSTQSPNQYMLKPTATAIESWEHIWSNYGRVENDDNYSLTYLDPEHSNYPGTQGDFYRGPNVSYVYQRNGIIMTNLEVRDMLELKSKRNKPALRELMAGVDTVVYKYTLDKSSFDQDANFPIYRAAGIHLYYAEIFARWRFPDGNGIVKPDVFESLAVLNDGTYDFEPKSQGVRGRAGFGSGIEAISLTDPIYIHDPIDNEVSGYLDYTGNLFAKQIYVEDQIMEERIREMAFEGERFYDLMRIAKRRDDPSYLADRVAAKFAPPVREQVREHLMIEDNWYINLK